MRILLTNDDGFQAEGINTLANYLRKKHEVYMVAPDRQRSACSLSITLHDPIVTRKIDSRTTACSGTPADCVNLGILGLLPDKPDIVVSGINHGANLGTDILYSGTAAGARQAVIKGIPGIAVSAVHFGSPNYDGTAEFILRNLESFKEQWNDNFFYNVNYPELQHKNPEVVLCAPSKMLYKGERNTFQETVKGEYHFYTGSLLKEHIAEGTDFHAISRGNIALSLIHVHPEIDGSQQKFNPQVLQPNVSRKGE